MNHKYCLLILLVLSILSCRRSDEGVVALLNRAQLIMEEHYDSSLVLLDSIDHPEQHLSEADYMRYLMSRVEAMNKAYMPIDTFSYMPQVVEYYQHHGTPYEKTNSLYLMGSIFRDRGDAPRAISYFKQAVAVEYPEYTKMDYLKISDAYGQMAELYSKMMYPRQALNMLDKRIEYALKSGDTLIAIQSYDFKSDEYTKFGMSDSAMNISKRAYKMFKERGEDRKAAEILPTQIYYYIKCDSLDKAREKIDEYVMKSCLVNPKLRQMNYDSNSIFYYKWGEFYRKINRNDSALYFFRKLLNINIDNNFQYGCKGLMDVYKELHEPDSVYKYATLHALAIDSARLENAENEITRIAALYDYNESERIALENERRADSLRTTVYVVISLFLLISLLLYIRVKHQRERKKAELMEVNQKYSETLIKYLQAEEEMKSLQSGVEERINRKAEEIEHLKRVLSSYQENVNADLWTTEQNLMQHEVVVQLHKDAAHARMATDSQWSDLEAVVSKFLPDFFNSLNVSREQLSEKEYRACLLTRLNFIPSEIGTLMNLTKQRISNMRSSVNGRLFGESGSKSFDTNIHKM